jgi:ribosomal protein L37E
VERWGQRTLSLALRRQATHQCCRACGRVSELARLPTRPGG